MKNPSDDAIARRLLETPLPAELESSLLASMAQAHGAGDARRARPAGRLAVAAAAAGLALLLGGLWIFSWGPQAAFAHERDFRQAMALYIARVPFQLDYTSRDLGSIDAWLEARSQADVPPLPSSLAGQPTLGCKAIDWGGVQVTLICFYETDPPGDRLVHLFVVPRSAIGKRAAAALETGLLAHGFDTRGWTTDEWVCVLVPSRRDMQVSPLLDDPAFVRPV